MGDCLEEEKPVADPKDPKYLKLRNWNLAMGILDVIQGIIMLWLASDYVVQIYTNFLIPGTYPPQYDYNVVYDLPMATALAGFLFISAAAHLSVSTFGYKWYVSKVSTGINPARWYEYAISSSLMIVIIAGLSGFSELGGLMLLIAANAAMNLFGLMMELHNQTTKKTDWTAFTLGSVVGAIPWVVIIMYFIGATSANAGGVPTFVYAAIIMLLIFWITFPINMILQYRKKGRWSDYLFGEKVYILLSLFSKSILAWIIFFGIQAR
jgi:hypothetical protein